MEVWCTKCTLGSLGHSLVISASIWRITSGVTSCLGSGVQTTVLVFENSLALSHRYSADFPGCILAQLVGSTVHYDAFGIPQAIFL